MSRAVVIKTYGDSAICNAITQGITSAELETVRAENRRLNAVNGVRSKADEKRWKRKKRKLANKYRVKPLGPVRGTLMAYYGLAVWLVHGAFEYIWEWNRTGVRPRGRL